MSSGEKHQATAQQQQQQPMGLRRRRGAPPTPDGSESGTENRPSGGMSSSSTTTTTPVRPSLASLAEERARRLSDERKFIFSAGRGGGRGGGGGGAAAGGGSPHWTHETMNNILGGSSVKTGTTSTAVRAGKSGSERSFLTEDSDSGGDGKASGGGTVFAGTSGSSGPLGQNFFLSLASGRSRGARDAVATVLGSKSDSENKTHNLGLVDYTFRLFSGLSILCWMTLVAIVYAVVPEEHLEYMQGAERTAPLIASAVLFVSILSWMLPLVLRQGARRALSGIMVGGITVQLIALLTEVMFVVLPVPVLVDPVTNVRVHLLRWCEWTPLAFLMTYLTEGTDVPKSHSARGWEAVRVPFLHGMCQGLSTLCGLLFPFSRGIVDWTVLMVISCVLFVVIYFRLAYKRKMFRGMERGTTVEDIETYARGKLSLGLLWTCTIMWSVLVVSYFLYSFLPFLVEDGSIYKHSSISMVSEAVLDVFLKVVYMKIIVNVHDSVFDDAARAERRLKELREMMSVVWDSSSDVIVVSVRGARGVISTMVSPTYTSIFKKSGDGMSQGITDSSTSNKEQSGLVFEFNPKDYQVKDSRKEAVSSLEVHDLDFTGLPSAKSRAASDLLKSEGLSSLAELVFRAWNLSSDNTTGNDGDNGTKRRSIGSGQSGIEGSPGSGDDSIIINHKLGATDVAGRWESKITRLRDSALVMVLRDTSERSRRFEAEKKYVSESTARMKDAEANRFTRHEVKNGLLSAIGLCDSFADSLQKVLELRKVVAAAQDETSLIIDAPSAAPVIDPSTSVCLHELDRTLNEVLHMVLADAMAREILHDVYEARKEYCDIVNAFSSHHHLRGFKAAAARFPLIVKPNPMPRVFCDLQLLTHIHRSSISNACKFGKKGGQVVTEVQFVQDVTRDGEGCEGLLEMKITNFPGPNHDKLLELGVVAEELVFARGTQLRDLLAKQGVQTHHSSGNGSWIVQKSARILGGSCSMRFFSDRTEFRLRFPTRIMKGMGSEAMDSTSMAKERFRIPQNTWGIAIDDSKIQRKLMERFLQYAGVKKDRCIVLGKNSSEIEGFVDFVVDFMDQNSDDHIFVIADENLDVVFDDAQHTTISGSLCIESIRKRLLPGQEMKLLALVRSANDSSNDIAIYNSRAHGFLPKAPLQRDKVLGMIAPLWEKRYPRSMSKAFYRSKSKEDHESKNDLSGYDSDAYISTSDLLQSIADIEDSVTGLSVEELAKRWGFIWEKLHALKGDMLSLDAGEDVRRLVYQINALRGSLLPPHFLVQWEQISSMAKAVIIGSSIEGSTSSQQ